MRDGAHGLHKTRLESTASVVGTPNDKHSSAPPTL